MPADRTPSPALIRSTVIQHLPGTSAKQDAGLHPTSPSPCRPVFLRVGCGQAPWIHCCSRGPRGDEMGNGFRAELGAPTVRQGPQLAPPAWPHSPEPPPCLALVFQTGPGQQALPVPEGIPRPPFLPQELCVYTQTLVLSAKMCTLHSGARSTSGPAHLGGRQWTTWYEWHGEALPDTQSGGGAREGRPGWQGSQAGPWHL